MVLCSSPRSISSLRSLSLPSISSAFLICATLRSSFAKSVKGILSVIVSFGRGWGLF